MFSSLAFSIVKPCEIMVTRKFWEFSTQTTACGREDLFFALHLILGRKLDICGRDDLSFFFFALHLILGGKLDISVVKTFKETGSFAQ